MKTKTPTHTPGPWIVRYREPGNPLQGFHVQAPRLHKGDGYDIEILCEDGNYPDVMRHADAVLISAAPELLAAAYAADALFQGLDDNRALKAEGRAEWAKVRAAIAKAEGR